MVHKMVSLAVLLFAVFGLIAIPNCANAFGKEGLENSRSLKVEEGYVPTDDGTRLFFQKVGAGKQTVIIPGGLFLFDDFQRLATGRTLIFYDMRGRGRSDAIPDDRKKSLVSIQDDVKDVERIRQFFKVKKFSLIGYSYLGLMTVMYAMDHPERVNVSSSWGQCR